MDYFAIVMQIGDRCLVAQEPAMVCRRWSLDELELDDATAWDTYHRLLERGLVPCQFYSARAPAGEFGHIQAERLHPLEDQDFKTALELLATEQTARYERHVCQTIGYRLVATT